MKRPASLVVALFLLAVACGQLMRVIFNVAVQVDGFSIPVWPSVVAMLVLPLLALWLLAERRR